MFSWLRGSIALFLLCAIVHVTTAIAPKTNRPDPPETLNEVLHYSANLTSAIHGSSTLSSVHAVATFVKNAGEAKGAKLLLKSLHERDGQIAPYKTVLIPGPNLSNETKDELREAGWKIIEGLRQIDHPFPEQCDNHCDDLNIINIWKLPFSKLIFIAPTMLAKSSIVPVFGLIQGEEMLTTDNCQGHVSTAVFGIVPSVAQAHTLMLASQKSPKPEQTNLGFIVQNSRIGRQESLPRAFNCERGCLEPQSQVDDVKCSIVYAPGSCIDFET